VTDTANSGENKAKQYKGLKPFVKGDPRINRKGAPKRGQSWRETVKRITDMTREEAIAYVGPTSKIGRHLKELSPDMPIKDAIIFSTIIAYGREPNARMLAALMDREDGKPEQAIGLDVKGNLTQRVIIEYAGDSDEDTPPETPPSTENNQSESQEV
jgi:hypothetical protein